MTLLFCGCACRLDRCGSMSEAAQLCQGVQPQGKTRNSECLLGNPQLNLKEIRSSFSDAGVRIIQQFSPFICLGMLIFHHRKLQRHQFVCRTQLLRSKAFSSYSIFPFLSCHRNKACWEVPAPVSMQRTFVLLSKLTHECMKVFRSCKHNRGSLMSQNYFH